VLFFRVDVRIPFENHAYCILVLNLCTLFVKAFGCKRLSICSGGVPQKNMCTYCELDFNKKNATLLKRPFD